MSRVRKVIVVRDEEGVWDVMIRNSVGELKWHSEHLSKANAVKEAVKYGYTPAETRHRISEDDRMLNRSIKLNDGRWRILLAAGHGNASIGVRRVIDAFVAKTNEDETNENESNA